MKRSSYYDSDYRQTAALIRARRPYIFKNMLVGSAIFAFVIGVCELHASASESLP
jgi:cytochrome c oxidase assembly factor 3